MKKGSIVSLTTAIAILLAVGYTGMAEAGNYTAPSFDFSSSSGNPTVITDPSTGVFTFSNVIGTISTGTFAGDSVKLTGSGSISSYDLSFLYGGNTYTTISGPATVYIPGELEVFGANGAKALIGDNPPTAGLIANYQAPAPEASALVAFGAMLTAGGILLFTGKKRIHGSTA